MDRIYEGPWDPLSVANAMVAFNSSTSIRAEDETVCLFACRLLLVMANSVG